MIYLSYSIFLKPNFPLFFYIQNHTPLPKISPPSPNIIPTLSFISLNSSLIQLTYIIPYYFTIFFTQTFKYLYILTTHLSTISSYYPHFLTKNIHFSIILVNQLFSLFYPKSKLISYHLIIHIFI